MVLELWAPSADRVVVVGSFDGWQEHPLERRGRWWAVALEVQPGTWEYAYLVDGEPVAPPEAALHRDDGFGGRNGVLVVEEP